MRYFLISILFLAGLITFQSCDKISPPYKESSGEIPDTVKVRKFLLEEFTGHTCPNCPQGAIVAQDLKEYYGDRLIIISIHAGDFAEPGTGDFTYDFRSPTGNDIFGFFQPSAFPSGMISRTGWSSTQNNTILDKNAWGPKIESLKAEKPDITIDISNTYNSGTRTVDANLEYNAVSTIDATYKTAVYITEDNIVKPQLTEDSIYHAYNHRHVLRASMNTTWGDTLLTGSNIAGSQFFKDYSYTLNSAWNEDNCYIVVIVFDADNYEIMQVEEKKIK